MDLHFRLIAFSFLHLQLLLYVHDNILIISCYSLDRRSGRYDDAVVINPGNFIR